jgi:chitin disaccharide deacetylase
MTQSRLIVHADDFGETMEITRGICAGLDARTVTSTSILANMPATDWAVAEAARRGRSSSFGVHLNLCEGKPLTPAPSLAGADGCFHRKRSLAFRALRGRLDLAEVERELRAQIQRIRDGGVQISHLDSHKHLHQLPGVAGVVARLAREFGLERIRCTLEAGLWPAGVRAAAVPSRLARRHLARRASRDFAAAGLRFPGRTFDVRQLIALPSAAGVALLRELPAVAELVCHPGTEAADREKPGSCHRHAELLYLTSDGFRDALAAAGVRLITYWDC